MTLWRIVLKEILHRKGNFLLSLLAVAIAVGCLVGALTLLRSHRAKTADLIAQRQTELEEQGRKLEDDMRKITKRMGFNIFIFPKDQNLHDVYASGYVEKTMPEEYVNRLATAEVIKSITHLLPTLTRKAEWPEAKRTVIVMGTRGQVAQKGADDKKPIQEPVAPGTMTLGYELHHQLGHKVGDKVIFMGKPFTVSKCHPAKGTSDDITLQIHLKEAQELLGLPGRINAILALECNCATLERLAEVRAEVERVLPGTQVIERHSEALARAETRNEAGRAAQLALESEKAYRVKQEQELEGFAALLVPLVLLGAAAAVGALAYYNVRARTVEIGTLRAIGWRTGQILRLFLSKALLLGLLGAALGYGAGYVFSVYRADGALTGRHFDAQVLALGLVLAPVLALTASWVPALLAARQDPAVVLREE